MRVDLCRVGRKLSVSSASHVERTGGSLEVGGVCGLTDCSLTTMNILSFSAGPPSSGADDLT